MAIDILFSVLVFLCVMLTCIPTLPGVPLLFGTVFIYGLVDGFETLEVWQLAVFGSLALLSLTIDYSSGLIGAKLGGASKKAVLFGLIGLVIGLISLPPFGALVGLFLGVFVAELIQFRNHERALRAASFSLAATIAGALANVFIAIGCFIGFLVIIF